MPFTVIYKCSPEESARLELPSASESDRLDIDRYYYNSNSELAAQMVPAYYNKLIGVLRTICRAGPTIIDSAEFVGRLSRFLEIGPLDAFVDTRSNQMKSLRKQLEESSVRIERLEESLKSLYAQGATDKENLNLVQTTINNLTNVRAAAGKLTTQLDSAQNSTATDQLVAEASSLEAVRRMIDQHAHDRGRRSNEFRQNSQEFDRGANEVNLTMNAIIARLIDDPQTLFILNQKLPFLRAAVKFVAETPREFGPRQEEIEEKARQLYKQPLPPVFDKLPDLKPKEFINAKTLNGVVRTGQKYCSEIVYSPEVKLRAFTDMFAVMSTDGNGTIMTNCGEKTDRTKAIDLAKKAGFGVAIFDISYQEYTERLSTTKFLAQFKTAINEVTESTKLEVYEDGSVALRNGTELRIFYSRYSNEYPIIDALLSVVKPENVSVGGKREALRLESQLSDPRAYPPQP